MPFQAQLIQTLKNYRLQPYPSFTGVPQPVTLLSIAHFLGALLWAWILLVCFVGWGRATARIFRVPAMPASIACSLGIAAVVFLGGLLNLLHAIYSDVLFFLVAAGLLFFLLWRKDRPANYRWLAVWTGGSRLSKLLLLIAIGILIARVAGTVRLGEFRVDDDGSAYLVYPQKMLTAHQFAADPFSDRRIISSVGGAYLLQSFLIAPMSLTHIGMADRTLGLALMFVALLDLGVAFGLSPPYIAILELVAYLVPQPTFNLSFQILPVPLLVAMVWVIYRISEPEDTHAARYALLLGLIGGLTISLKSTFLPYVGALALFPFLFIFWRNERSNAWKLPLLAGLGSLILLAAWMIAMKQYSGTYLFPVLGRGFDYSRYSYFRFRPEFVSSVGLLRIALQGALLLALAAIQFFSGTHDRTSKLSFSILVAAALAITAFNWESGGDYIWRYNFPQFFTAVVVLFAAQAACMSGRPSARSKTAFAIAVLALVGCIFYYDLEGGKPQPLREMRTDIRLYRRNLRVSLSGMQLVSPAVRKTYRDIETALPRGSTALDVTTDSFLLTDRDGRRILLDDWPGAASPPPGWPFARDSDAVPAFLRKRSVRYIVYGYDYASWADTQSCQSLFTDRSHLNKLDHALELLEMVTHNQLDGLRKSHRTLYDDGKIAVIDLDSRLPSAGASARPWTLATDEAAMCLQISQRYISAHPSKAQSKTDDN